MPDRTRERLVDHALALLASEGVDAVTVRRVAREAGMSHGAPLRHFPTHADLLAAMAATGFAQLRTQLSAVPGPEHLAAACRSYVDFALAAPALYELMFRVSPMEPETFQLFRRLAGNVPAGPLWATLHGLVHMGLTAELDTVLRCVITDAQNSSS